ncbi:MAG: hypothetical protein H6766_06125 [Candidatus Peribacteria bacterium]|nr:MAG: hypothetical protein H6766_06125 [Candidatus Peribacteria bacterium]
MSFFVTQALVDISTIGVTAMGGLSEIFVSNNTNISNDLIKNIGSKKTTITYTAEGKAQPEVVNCNTTPSDDHCTNNMSAEDMLDKILPKGQSMA